jgi:type IV pilus assembly protein PilB
MIQYNPNASALQQVSRELALKYEILPLSLLDGNLEVLTWRPLAANALWDLMFVTNFRVSATIIDRTDLLSLIDRFLPHESNLPELVSSERRDNCIGVIQDSYSEQSESNVISDVNAILNKGIAMQTSDIHFEPASEELRVRFRVDGVLQTMWTFTSGDKMPVTARLKLMAGMDVAERRKPQDGRIRLDKLGAPLDIRVSSIPTSFGEKLVLRLLDKSQNVTELSQLGMSAEDLGLFKRHISRPQGMVLVTGPTGSGKTTTLYGALSYLSKPEVNIMTIEDPIEYEVAGVTQSQVKPEIEYEFSTALRAFLRQDPDIIMVGEIRDFETAQIALRAAMTGHLVLSSVHTNNAPATVTRLIDLGVEPYLVASSLTLVVAQRLMRRLCPRCKVPDELSTFKAGSGCRFCNQSGYRGRIGIFEMLEITDEMREAIQRHAPASQLEFVRRNQGALTLLESASNLLEIGMTSRYELQRVLGGEL